MDSSSRLPEPTAPDPLLRWALGLLGAAFILELYVSNPWTEPFFEWDTWVLAGVFLGFGFRRAGQHLDQQGQAGRKTFRWASLLTWAASAIGGLAAWIYT